MSSLFPNSHLPTPPPSEISFLVYLEIIDIKGNQNWKRLDLCLSPLLTVMDLVNIFWKQMNLCFVAVEFCCSPKDKKIHRLTEQEFYLTLGTLFYPCVSIIGNGGCESSRYLVFCCCYFAEEIDVFCQFLYGVKIFYQKKGEILCVLLKFFAKASTSLIERSFRTLVQLETDGKLMIDCLIGEQFVCCVKDRFQTIEDYFFNKAIKEELILYFLPDE